MYVLQEKPDGTVTLEGGSVCTPLATLKDEYGGVSHIIEDDHCYILVNGGGGHAFNMVCHWYPEAVDALKTLPTPQYP